MSRKVHVYSKLTVIQIHFQIRSESNQIQIVIIESRNDSLKFFRVTQIMYS